MAHYPDSGQQDDETIAVLGLGYVGLPLAVAFGGCRNVIGFDTDASRIAQLKERVDKTREVSEAELCAATRLVFTGNPEDLVKANIFIVTVPTPVTRANEPDLGPLLSASRLVGAHLKHGDVVIYESTVYPGATEDDCVPVLESSSGLKYNEDFFCGYSPERINPGDDSRKLPDIVKVTSGSTPAVAEKVDQLYAEIITAGTHKAESIRVAEAAKVIENTQRDVNIALINELAMLFGELNIDTRAVLRAASTKWNFLPFVPGLVGGHCIGVDPYYLTHKAKQINFNPRIILAGREINDHMSEYVVTRFLTTMKQKMSHFYAAEVLIMGLTFKENCPDLRNSKVLDIHQLLRSEGIQVHLHDPFAEPAQVLATFEQDLVTDLVPGSFDGVILAVSHDDYRSMGGDYIRSLCKPNGTIFDVKNIIEDGPGVLRL